MTRRALLDVNVLLALSNEDHIHHNRAHQRFASIDLWCTTPITELGLLRLLLTEPVMGRVVRPLEALEQVRALRTADGWSWVADDLSPTSWRVGGDSVRGRRQVTDLHLVNLAASNGCILATFDAGIRRNLRQTDRALVEIWE